MTVLQDIVRGAQASVTLDNINLSQDYTGSGPGSTHTGSRSIGLVGNKSATYEQIYREQLWVNSIVNKLSRGIGRLPLKTYSGPGAERERRRDGPLYDLMSAPEEDVSPFHFKSAIVGNVGVHGNCVGVKVRPGAREQSRGRTPVGLSTSSWRYWSVVEGKDQRADWYVFTKAGIRIPFLPEEVVHFRFWGTGADIVGPSSIEALRRTLQIEDAAQRQQIASFENANRPSGAFAVQQDVKKETLECMRDQLHETYGGVDNAYKIAMLGGGAKWEPMSFDSGQAELISARHLTREECAAAYDMPPPVIQILDKATFSNVTEQHKMLYQDTLGPWLTMIEETLQTQLIDPEPAFAGQYVEFDLAEVLKGDIATRYAAYAAATWMSLNEKRERENLPPKESPLADALWMPPGSIPIHPDVAPEPIVPPPPGASAEELRCPNCSQLVGRNITGGDFTCRRCKTEFSA